MLRIYSFALSMFMMFFVIIFLCELIVINLEMTKFFSLFENIKNNFPETFRKIYKTDWIQTFLRTPKFLSEYESRYDCTVRAIPIYEQLLESLVNFIGYEYTAFDPWRHCRIYDHEVVVFNPDYGNLIMSDLKKISFISLASTTGLFLLMLIVANDWLLEKGHYFFNRFGMVKDHVWRDDYNFYRAISRGLLGKQERYREMDPRIPEGSDDERLVSFYKVISIGSLVVPSHAVWIQFVTNFELAYTIYEKFKIPLEVFKDGYKSIYSDNLTVGRPEKQVNVNEEEDGWYTALVPSRFARLQYRLLEFICYPYKKVFRGGHPF